MESNGQLAFFTRRERFQREIADKNFVAASAGRYDFTQFQRAIADILDFKATIHVGVAADGSQLQDVDVTSDDRMEQAERKEQHRQAKAYCRTK